MLLIQINLGRPYYFFQKRPGLNGKPFILIKFRTMKIIRDKNNKLLSDKDRFTKFGSFLRKTSLDEIPTFWNVLIGEMSLVGPRPLLMEYMELYNSRQIKRQNVKSGITGWAQINGRNDISWEEKFELDLWYVENQSFWLDIKILLITIPRVFKKKGISHFGHTTMHKFKGSKL